MQIEDRTRDHARMILTIRQTRKESCEKERTEDYTVRQIRSSEIAGLNLLWKVARFIIDERRSWSKLQSCGQRKPPSRAEIIAPLIHHRA